MALGEREMLADQFSSFRQRPHELNVNADRT